MRHRAGTIARRTGAGPLPETVDTTSGLLSIERRLNRPFTREVASGEDPRRRQAGQPTPTTPTRSSSRRRGEVDTTGLEAKPNPFDEYALETALRLTENGTEPEGAPGRGGRRHLRPEGGRADAPRDARHRRRPRDPRRRDGRAARRRPRGARPEGASSTRRSRTSFSSGTSRPRASRTRSASSSPSTSAGRRRRSRGSIKSEDDKALVVGREVDGGDVALRVTLPAVVTVIDKIVDPKSVQSKHTPATHTYPDGVRFAALMAIMAAKKKPLAEVKLAELVPDAASRSATGRPSCRPSAQPA